MLPKREEMQTETEEVLTKLHHHKHVILTTLSQCKTLNHLKQVQALVTTIGHSQTQFYAFKLLRLAAVTLGDLTYTRRLFDSLRAPNVFVFSAAIAAHAADIRHRRTAFELFRLMLRRGVSRPNHFVFPHALKSCSGVLPPRAFGSLHSHIVKTGFEIDLIVRTGLVGLYAKHATGLESARKVFDEMSERNVVAWTAMVSGHARAGDVGEALAFFERMSERDIAAWNAVISGFAQNDHFEQAISLFERMMMVGPGRVGVRPNGVTVSSVLSACARSGSIRLGKFLHGYACRNGIVPCDQLVSNGLVDMYGKCGSLVDAKRVFDGTHRKSTMTWNSMINCYAIHGRSQDAIRLFEKMMLCKDGNTLPDEITFVGVLSACAHGGLVEEATSYFRLMSERYGIEPEVEHYGCLIDLLARAGRFDEAAEIVNGMRSQRDEVIWSSLLNNSKIHRRVKLAEFAVRKLEEIDPRNGWYAIMLANLYRDLGKWEEHRRIRKRMKENSCCKTPGFSRIEIGERVWQFYAGDWSHPKVDEILVALESLASFLTHKPSAEVLVQ